MNTAFIGMPGSGKTTVSRRVAQTLGRKWYDSDELIAAQEQMSIPDIFTQHGENYFRERETECVERLTRLDNAVISLGGGAVLRNAELIRTNAVVIYLERSIDDIARTLEPGTRPLAGNTERLRELYKQRRELYESLCDYRIMNDGTVNETVQKILEALS